MPRTNLEFAQETNRWKNYLLDVDSIPFSDTHIFKNPNDVYERLTQHVKNWAEGELGYFLSAQDKKLHRISGSLQRTQESHDLSEQIGSLMAPLDANWYSAALSGNKKTSGFLPHYPEQSQNAVNQRMDAIREQVKSTFLPAYRALHESFSKRHFWQWITQHAQYTAERDALKVMKNVIKSVTNMTDSELKDALAENQRNITEEYVQEIGNDLIPGIKMYQPTEKTNDNVVHDFDRYYGDFKIESNQNAKDNIILDDEVIPENDQENKSVDYVFPPFSHQEVSPMMLLDPEYVPNVFHIDQEFHLAERWYRIMREANDYLQRGSKTGIPSNSPIAKFSKALKKNPKMMPVFRKNYDFAKGVWETDGKKGRIDYVYSKLSEHKEEMQEILNGVSKYKIPDPIEGLVSIEQIDEDIKRTNEILEEKKKEEEEIANITEEDIKKSFVKDTLLEEKPELKDNPELLNKLTEERYERWTLFDEIVEKNPDIKDQDVLNKMTDEELARRHAEQNKHERVDLSNEFKDDKNVEKSEVVSEPPYVNKEIHP